MTSPYLAQPLRSRNQAFRERLEASGLRLIQPAEHPAPMPTADAYKDNVLRELAARDFGIACPPREYLMSPMRRPSVPRRLRVAKLKRRILFAGILGFTVLVLEVVGWGP